MSQSFDASRSLTALEQDNTIIAVIEMSKAKWLIAALVPGLKRQPLKKIDADAPALLKLLQRWRDEAGQAGHTIKRIAVAYEAAGDGFWLARWLQAHGIEAYAIHPSSVPVSREHRRAKTDRLDTELLMRAFLGWLRGEKRHCSMAAIPTIEEEDARRPNRERESLVGEQTRLINRFKAVLARFGIRRFRLSLRGAAERLGAIRTAEGTPLPDNTRAELHRFQLYLLGSTGSINLPYDSALVSFGQILVMPDWLSYLLVAAVGVAIFVTRIRTASRRRSAGLSSSSTGAAVLHAVAITALLALVVIFLNQSRGVPWMFGLFVGLVVLMNYAFTRTQWGRSMTAVGGNREAARRAGINVKRIYTSAFVLCATLAAVGGVLAAARLAASSQQAGTGDVNLNAIAAAVIGGTSLFGGRGSAYSALLGIIVIQAIASGLTLLDLSSSLRYMITGGVLAIAVIVDSLARRSRLTHGRA